MPDGCLTQVDADLGAVVDQLGRLKAAIAELESEEKELKQRIVNAGRAELDGHLFRATVSLAERTTIDTAALRKRLGDELLRPFERQTEVTTVRVTARKAA